MRSKARLLLALGAVIALAVTAAGCGGSSTKSSNGGSTSSSGSGGSSSNFQTSYDNGTAKRGGTYRVGWESSFGFTDNFDPTGEYLGDAWGILENLLIRPLVGYKHVGGNAGNDMIGDLAQSVPQPTDNGLTYTYKLRTGVKFGPPVNRAVTSKDVAYALNRLADPANGGQYGPYYSVIRGWNAVANGQAKTVTGISTPDNQTIVIHLTTKTGDFNRRMSLPATAPIPPEVGRCFEHKPGDYGRDLISSGPYMIAGSAGSFTSCAALKPFSGYAGASGNHLTLVRNPNYKQSTDQYRKNYPDKFTFVINSNADDIYNRVQSGQLDDETASAQPKTIRQYATNPSLRKMLLTNGGDRTWYLTLNLTQPPFDDIHIRKAMNLIIDKQALRKAWGGPFLGAIATHIAPPVMYGGGLSEYDPYATPNESGSVKLASAEVKKSKYDPNHTGKCTASACKHVLMVADTRALDARMVPVIENSAAKIGITFTVRSINGAYPTIQTTSKNIPFNERAGWGKDYADAYTFFAELFTSQAIQATGNANYSLVGLTPQLNQQKKLGVTGTLTGIPSIDSDVANCEPKLGAARTTCWENLDKKLMTQVVPWVPYLWSNVVRTVGPKVTHWAFDQFSTTTAYSQVAVKS